MLLTLFPNDENNDFLCETCNHLTEKEHPYTGTIKLHCPLFDRHFPNQNFDQLAVCVQSCTHAKLY